MADKLVYNHLVYTSSFKNVAKHVLPSRRISIAITCPQDFEGGFYKELNPPSHLLMDYKSGNMTSAEFEEIYRREVLDYLDPNEVYEAVKGKVMCCWEPKGRFCHRHLVIKWLEENLGDNIIGGEL